jgi:threonine/homoserine/homoserine lactone efflux protein
MDLDYLLRGLVIGVSIAAPVGPIGLLCIRRTLAGGRLVGLVSGLGAATADAAYGAVAGFGLTAVAGLLVGQSLWLRLLGGLFLGYLGVRTALTPPASRAAGVSGRGLAGAYASTLALTLTTPTTILSFVAIFAGLGIAGAGGDYGAAAALVLGVFAGSALWWLVLSGGVGLLRGAVTPGALRWVNRLSGALIAAIGLAALASLLRGG